MQRICNFEKNRKNCNCTYQPCSRKGYCCECVSYHWRNKELPACFFPKDLERNYDRSLSAFIDYFKKFV
ncbi:MAG TPA: hypothetical protein DHV62_04090 [Elusimicrobia bacterium]|nr:hypothetical protein [Elusimicrobiota bacterium]